MGREGNKIIERIYRCESWNIMYQSIIKLPEDCFSFVFSLLVPSTLTGREAVVAPRPCPHGAESEIREVRGLRQYLSPNVI